MNRRNAIKALAISAGAVMLGGAAGCSSGVAIPRDVGIWDLVEFGSYPQSSSGKAAPITWRVLNLASNYALLISEYALECLPYNKERVDCTWEDCSLRAWLNGEFLETAFSEKEREHVSLFTVKNKDTEAYGTT